MTSGNNVNTDTFIRQQQKLTLEANKQEYPLDVSSQLCRLCRQVVSFVHICQNLAKVNIAYVSFRVLMPLHLLYTHMIYVLYKCTYIYIQSCIVCKLRFSLELTPLRGQRPVKASDPISKRTSAKIKHLISDQCTSKHYGNVNCGVSSSKSQV